MDLTRAQEYAMWIAYRAYGRWDDQVPPSIRRGLRYPGTGTWVALINRGLCYPSRYGAPGLTGAGHEWCRRQREADRIEATRWDWFLSRGVPMDIVASVSAQYEDWTLDELGELYAEQHGSMA